MTSIIHQTLNQNCLPDVWRDAWVTPVFKKGGRSNPANYRLMSLTCTVGKLVEHILELCTHIRGHLDAEVFKRQQTMDFVKTIPVKHNSSSLNMSCLSIGMQNAKSTLEYSTSARPSTPCHIKVALTSYACISGGTRLGSVKSTIALLVSMNVDDRNRF